MSDRPAAMFVYAVQVAVLELRNLRTNVAAQVADTTSLKHAQA